MSRNPITPKLISKREYELLSHRLYFTEDNILYVTINGPLDKELALKEQEIFLKFIELMDKSKKINVIIDLNNAGKVSADARKILKKMNDHPNVNKIAHFGLHPVARVLANFVIGISKNKNMLFVKTKEEALNWIHSNSLDSEAL